ncbi:MAG: EAL domain-containing protein [Clostridia bacterium]|nr:EAL domain-containing protein [Clostridia bacterium]
MDEYGEIFDTYIEPEEISNDIMDIKEVAKLNGIISKLKMYHNNPTELTKVYTNILFDDNVSFIMTKVSQDQIFASQFPEFYEVNSHGENMINCQQNSTYHKYGTFKHTLAAIEFVGNPQIPIGDWQKRILKWTMLLHDIGKPYVKTIAEDGTESFAGHDDKSVELAIPILNRFYFSEDEKRIILTLIKYHDRFLNEGEITNDNMKFLASELNNNKELFYLLLDVKDADAKAKCLEVYSKFKIVKNKYMEFVNNYFSYKQEKEAKPEEADAISGDREKARASVNELETLLDSVLTRRAIKTLYQPIVDLKLQSVWAYEVFTKIESKKKIDIMEFFEYSKDVKKHDKLQQILLINGIEDFEALTVKEANKIIVNVDLYSYDNYINKPRIYDMMRRNKVIVEFQNYERKDFNKLQDIIGMIHKNGGFVALDNFGISTLNLDDINMLNIDYIVPDISMVRGILEDEDKQRFLSDLLTFSTAKECELILVGVENKEILEFAKRIGVRYVQGYYFARPDFKVISMNNMIKEKIKEASEDEI